MLAAVLLTTTLMATAWKTPTPNATQVCQRRFERLMDIERRSPETALDLAENLEARCKLSPDLMAIVHVLRADLELRLGRPEAALATLDAHPLSRADLMWTMAQWRYLSAYEALGDLPAYRRVRDGLLAANAEALASDPSRRMGHIDHFAIPGAEVDVYEGRLVLGKLTRLMFFIAAPTDGGPIVTVALEVDPTAGKTEARHLISLYDCDGKELEAIATGPAGADPPDYPALKAVAVRVLTSPGVLAPFARQPRARTCGFAPVILPGLPYPLRF